MSSTLETTSTFKRIIVALRFNKVGQFALIKGIDLARVHRARLQIFHALDYRLLHPNTPEEKIIELTKSAQQDFERELKPLLGDFQEFAFNCWEADPSVEVCKLASSTHADLIVIGCHQSASGRSVSRVGEVGNAILQTAPCPVLLIPCPDEAPRAVD